MKRARELAFREITGRFPQRRRVELEVERGMRMIQYFIDMSDDFWYPFHTWPEWVREQIILEHKNNSQRYNLFVFFVLNGLGPNTAARWITVSRIEDETGKRGRVYHGNYDAQAMRQLYDQMPRQLEEGTLVKDGKRVFDMQLGRPVAYQQQPVHRHQAAARDNWAQFFEELIDISEDSE